MTLNAIFHSNKYKINKWSNYFDIYERHFQAYIGKKIVFLEIGVQHGGSLKMWKDYFGENATIVGIDINSSCKQHELAESNIYVRIGSQVDETFLQSVIDEFGNFDIVLDDGSHKMEHVFSTFNYIYIQN